MDVSVRPYRVSDVEEMRSIWNEVVRDGIAFPQENELSHDEAAAFFAEQTHCGVAVARDRVVGMYVLHPNNVGRCSHIANASFAVASDARGMRVGRALVTDAIEQLSLCGFSGLQFNAVVDSNASARHLYESLGFAHIGTIPCGFRMKDGSFEDIHIYYHGA